MRKWLQQVKVIHIVTGQVDSSSVCVTPTSSWYNFLSLFTFNPLPKVSYAKIGKCGLFSLINREALEKPLSLSALMVSESRIGPWKAQVALAILHAHLNAYLAFSCLLALLRGVAGAEPHANGVGGRSHYKNQNLSWQREPPLTYLLGTRHWKWLLSVNSLGLRCGRPFRCNPKDDWVNCLDWKINEVLAESVLWLCKCDFAVLARRHSIQWGHKGTPGLLTNCRRWGQGGKG